MKHLVWLAGVVLTMGVVVGCGSDTSADTTNTAATAPSGGIPAGEAKTTEGGADPAAATPAPDWAKTGTPGG